MEGNNIIIVRPLCFLYTERGQASRVSAQSTCSWGNLWRLGWNISSRTVLANPIKFEKQLYSSFIAFFLLLEHAVGVTFPYEVVWYIMYNFIYPHVFYYKIKDIHCSICNLYCSAAQKHLYVKQSGRQMCKPHWHNFWFE